MTSRMLFVSVGVAATLGITPVAAQHDQHQAGAQASGASAAQVSQCVQAQPVVTNLLEASLKRIEDARLTNNAAAMRDAAEDLQSALIDIRTQLAPCATMQAATDAHAGHTMPNVQQAPPAAPGTPAMQPGSPTPAPAAVRPSAPSPAGADPHAGHAMPAPAAPAAPPGSPSPARSGLLPTPATALAALTCQRSVDAKTAPRMLHQGRMYYFCSEQDRAAFAKDPSKYALPAGEAAPAHAH